MSWTKQYVVFVCRRVCLRVCAARYRFYAQSFVYFNAVKSGVLNLACIKIGGLHQNKSGVACIKINVACIKINQVC
jgi:hypothetical protein